MKPILFVGLFLEFLCRLSPASRVPTIGVLVNGGGFPPIAMSRLKYYLENEPSWKGVWELVRWEGTPITEKTFLKAKGLAGLLKIDLGAGSPRFTLVQAGASPLEETGDGTLLKVVLEGQVPRQNLLPSGIGHQLENLTPSTASREPVKEWYNRGRLGVWLGFAGLVLAGIWIANAPGSPALQVRWQ